MCKQEPCSLLNEWIALLAKSTGDIVEWDASGLLHRIIERREGVFVDVCVACRSCVPEKVLIGQEQGTLC